MTKTKGTSTTKLEWAETSRPKLELEGPSRETHSVEQASKSSSGREAWVERTRASERTYSRSLRNSSQVGSQRKEALQGPQQREMTSSSLWKSTSWMPSTVWRSRSLSHAWTSVARARVLVQDQERQRPLATDVEVKASSLCNKVLSASSKCAGCAAVRAR